MEPVPSNITELLLELENGKAEAADQLFPLVYDQLRRIARRHMHGERPDHTLQATALVNEALLELLQQSPRHFEDRTHFLAYVANAMRNVLRDYARIRNAKKRSGGRPTVPLDEAFNVGRANATYQFETLLSVNNALDRLAKFDARQAKVFELRFFGGLGVGETAEEIRISPTQVKRDWRIAKAWLKAELESSPHGDDAGKVGSR
jgi:RNA polymerase sigma factor (TIGR02999 family)